MARGTGSTGNALQSSPAAQVLVLVAVVALVQFVLIAGMILSAFDGSHIVDISGAQRMRTQRIAFLALAARTGYAPRAWRAELTTAVDELLAVRTTLLARRDLLPAPPDASGDTPLSRAVSRYAAAARAIVADPRDRRALDELLANREPLLRAVDGVVRARAQLLERRNVQLIAGLGLGLVAMCAIMAIAFARILAPAERLAEILLGRLEKRNELMLMAEAMAHVGQWRFDLVTRELWWSDEMERNHGSAATVKSALEAAIAGRAGAAADSFAAAVTACLATGVPFVHEAQIERPDATVRSIVSHGQAERGPNGAVVAVFGVSQDVTDTRDAERERRQLLERITLATRAGNVGIWEWDLLTNALVWDRNMCALWGRENARDAPTFALWTASIFAADKELVAREFRAAIDGGTTLDLEYRIVWPNGEIRCVRGMGTVVYDADGRASRMLGTIWDVTEVRTLAEQLRHEKSLLGAAVEKWTAAKTAADAANRAKSEFLARISHEIRTPLNGIVGFATLVLENDLSAQVRQQLTYLLDAGTSLTAIINDLLDFSKIEAGKMEFERIPLSIRAVIDGAVALSLPDARSKGIVLEAEVDASVPPWVAGDPTRIRQVALNLLTNAVKFTECGSVRIFARYRDGQLAVDVTDTGIGIPLDGQSGLFVDFSQLNASTARRYGGTGLGLAICRRLVAAMDGSIGVISAAGRGSTFWFTIPLPEVAAPALVACSAEPPAALRLLVVDDNAINQIVAETLLKRDGHAVTLVADGAQAVAAVEAACFDVVLMDMEMPVLDGVGATRAIRALTGPARDVPIVALTANAMVDDVQRCYAAGMNGHLAKPLDRNALRAMLAIWGKRPRAQATAPATPSALGPAFRDLPMFPIARLMANTPGGRDAVIEMLDAATTEIAADLSDLHAAVAAGDARTAQRLLLQIRDRSDRLGSDDLVAIADELAKTSGCRTIDTSALLAALTDSAAMLEAEARIWIALLAGATA